MTSGMQRFFCWRNVNRCLLVLGLLGGGIMLFQRLRPAVLALFDESLLPEARQWYAQPPRPLPKAGSNGFYAALGLLAPADDLRSGREHWARIENAARRNQPQPRLHPSLELPTLPQCQGDGHCLRQLREKVDAPALISSHQRLLQRYQALHAYHSISRPLLPANSMELSGVFLHPRMARLWQLQQMQRWQQGEAAAVLQAIAADMRLWRNSVNDATNLLDATLASAFLVQDYELLAELQSMQPHQRRNHAVQWRQLLAPAATSGIDFRLMLWGELRAVIQIQEQARHLAEQDSSSPAEQWLAATPFWQKNRSLNQLYRQQLRIQQQWQLPPAQLARIKDDAGPDCKAGAHYAANPVGRILNCLLDDSMFHSSHWQLHQAEALRRLIILRSQLQMHSFKDGPLRVDASLRNPWDGRAPEVKNGQLHFYWPCPKCRHGELVLP